MRFGAEDDQVSAWVGGEVVEGVVGGDGAERALVADDEVDGERELGGEQLADAGLDLVRGVPWWASTMLPLWAWVRTSAKPACSSAASRSGM